MSLLHYTSDRASLEPLRTPHVLVQGSRAKPAHPCQPPSASSVRRTTTPYPPRRNNGSVSPSIVSWDSDATVLWDVGQGVAREASPIPSDGNRGSVAAAHEDAVAGASPRANISQAELDHLLDRQVSFHHFRQGGKFYCFQRASVIRRMVKQLLK